jgi:hypothetical protein
MRDGQSTCTLMAPRETTASTPDAQHAAQPMSTAAVRRHLIKLGKVYEFRIYESMTDLNLRPQPQSEPQTPPQPHRTQNNMSTLIESDRLRQSRYVTQLPDNQKGPVAPDAAQLEPDVRHVFTLAYRVSVREREGRHGQTGG